MSGLSRDDSTAAAVALDVYLERRGLIVVEEDGLYITDEGLRIVERVVEKLPRLALRKPMEVLYESAMRAMGDHFGRENLPAAAMALVEGKYELDFEVDLV